MSNESQPAVREFEYENEAGNVRVRRRWERTLGSTVLETDTEEMYNFVTGEWEESHSFERTYEITDDGLLVGDESNWDGEGRLWWEYAGERHRKRLRLRFPFDFDAGDDDVSLREAVRDAIEGQL